MMGKEIDLKEAYRRSRVQQIAEDLTETLPDSEKLRLQVAQSLLDMEYRKERHGVWIRDDTCRTRGKDIYYCTACNHWQSVRKGNQIQFMNYCTLCGARMDKPKSDYGENSNEQRTD